MFEFIESSAQLLGSHRQVSWILKSLSFFFLKIIIYIKLITKLRHLHVINGRHFTEVQFLSLFDVKDGIRELQHLHLHRCSAFIDNCVNALTEW